ncbi:MAG: PLP-dependent aminotransferase family protein [Oscillospiraceae bacterium]|nr:PLP-dependent aminotransferase family protein [Oscillospiraceae bacterium]
MQLNLSDRILKPDFQGEFTASILAAAASPDLISFAGGLPNPVSFPIPEMEAATKKVLEENGVTSLQYNATQGWPALRKWIAKRYETMGVYGVEADDIIVTNGSQQALAMFGHAFINAGDEIIVEDPTYLVALQSFHVFDPCVLTVTMNPDGIDCEELARTIAEHPKAKFAYLIPNFQNPTGLSYSQEVHDKVVEIIKNSNVMILEDNPYRELRFAGTATNSFGAELGEQCCMLGTFSKIVTPGMRIGWICVRNKELRAKLLGYKATADLHTSIFSQMVIAQYLADNDVDEHIAKTKVLYKAKSDLMVSCLRKYLPAGCELTPTEGGMFLWVTLPNNLSSVDLYRKALEKGVAICPGDPFYEYQRNVSSFRINYSNSTDEAIEKGIKILAEACEELINEQ